jgi:hypothetical protein
MGHRHSFRYYGGVAKCQCGKYLQPDGRVTDTPTGRTRKKKK